MSTDNAFSEYSNKNQANKVLSEEKRRRMAANKVESTAMDSTAMDSGVIYILCTVFIVNVSIYLLFVRLDNKTRQQVMTKPCWIDWTQRI